MAINKYSTGNLHNFYYGGTTSTDNTVNLTDSDFGTTNEFYCVNTTPMTITVPAGATLNGVSGGSVVLNQGEYCKIISISQNTWIYMLRLQNANTTTLGLVKQLSNLPAGSTIDQLLTELKSKGLMVADTP